MDAVFAIAAVEASASGQGIVGSMHPLQSRFPEDPYQEYVKYARYILVKLGLEGQIRYKD